MLNKTQHKQLINLSTKCPITQLIKPVEKDEYYYFCVGTGHYITRVKKEILNTSLLNDFMGNTDFSRCINAETHQRFFGNCKKLVEFPLIDTKVLSKYIKHLKQSCKNKSVHKFVFGDVKDKLFQLVVNAEYLLKHLKMYGKIPYRLYGGDYFGSAFPALFIESDDMSSIILGCQSNIKQTDTYSQLDKILSNEQEE